MAEKNEQNVFKNLLDAIKKDKGIGSPTNAGQSAKAPFQPNGSLPVEDQQQKFLDWQVQKVANDIYSRTIYFDTDRVSAYQDYEAMDHSPEVHQALNIMRDECLTPNEYGDILQIYSDQERVKEVLKDLFKNRLNIDYMLRLWIRELLKFGDHFVYLKIDKEQGVVNINNLPPSEIHREEGYDNDMGSVRFRWEGGSNIYFEEWQVAHFRLMEDTKRLPYGRSILDAARKTWKQLQLAEDAMLIYRLVRSPDRRVFYIEVGNLAEADVGPFIQNMQKAVKKAPIVDPRNGNKNFKYNPQNISEDYFLPVRGEHHSRIDTLPGACLALDTKIELLDGRSLTLQEIIKEHESGKQLWSYSIDPNSGKIVPGKITWAGTTRKNTQVVRLTLDNGETIVCTPDHKYDTKFNGEKEAKDLLGESLWSFSKEFKTHYKSNRKDIKYEHVYDHSLNDFVCTHKMVGEFTKQHHSLYQEMIFNPKYELEDKNTIHHKSFRRLDNTPENLAYMNYYDHREMHGSLVKQYKKERIAGIKKYWANISPEELEKKCITGTNNVKKGPVTLQLKMKDPAFKKAFYEKTSKALQVTQNRPEFKAKMSIRSKALWQDEAKRNSIIEKQKLKYSNEMLQYVVGLHKEGLDGVEIVKRINEEGSWFMIQLRELNAGNGQFLKMKKGFTNQNLSKMMKAFGYAGWRDFKNKAECFNHKVVAVEWLEEKQDTGTLTIDGQEEHHSFHNFALTCGVFTRNSNMNDIMDIKYLENKLFCSLVVPKAYLNFGEGAQGGSTLSQADIRFARTIIGFQEVILMELRKIAKVHLFLLGYKEDCENFSLKLNNPSTQMELMKLEIMKARLEVGKEWHNMDANSPASWTWVMENIYGFSKNDIKKMLNQKKIEKKLFAEIDAAPETYKKTGIFRALDSKFEMAGAPPEGGTNSEEGSGDGGGGGGSALGGGGLDDMGGAPPMDSGGDDAGGGGGDAGAPAPPPAPSGGASAPEMALSEAASKKRMDSLMNELFEDDNDPSSNATISPKQSLVEKSDEMFKSTESLFASLENKFGADTLKNVSKRRELFKEMMLVSDTTNNPLGQTHNEQAKRIAKIIEEIEAAEIGSAQQNVLPDNATIEESDDEEEAHTERQ